MSAANEHLDTAVRFAHALDAGDDGTIAAPMIAEDCRYVIRDKEYIGPEAIMQTYVDADENARKKFDSVVYDSSVETLEDSRYVIKYLDRLGHAGETHDHRCEQVLTFNTNGKICAIEHVDLPGESEALIAFLGRVGLESSS